MKLFLSFLLMLSSAFAQDSIICSETKFSDLVKIEVSETDYKGQFLITEIKASGEKTSLVQNVEVSASGDMSIELSSWFGYSRTLVLENGSWSIETADECGISYSSVVCK